MATPVWLDYKGPVAAVLFTDWGESCGIDLLRVPDGAPAIQEVWAGANGATVAAGWPQYVSLVPDDDDLVSLLPDAGFAPDSCAWEAWMDPAARTSAVRALAGYKLIDRAADPALHHPMIARNGPEHRRLGRRRERSAPQ